MDGPECRGDWVLNEKGDTNKTNECFESRIQVAKSELTKANFCSCIAFLFPLSLLVRQRKRRV